MKNIKNLYVLSWLIFNSGNIFSSDQYYYDLNDPAEAINEESILDEVEKFYPAYSFYKSNKSKYNKSQSFYGKDTVANQDSWQEYNQYLPSKESDFNQQEAIKNEQSIRKILQFLGLSYSSDVTWSMIEEAYRKKIDKFEKSLKRLKDMKIMLEKARDKGLLPYQLNNMDMPASLSFEHSYSSMPGDEGRTKSSEG